ncbi:hypothetical protein B0A48_11807 [Cryoendolithus antarcticus]|uniref:Uncharacterized protein n=1 Tax=Cryoendolithus antarcticus TaxID=1507870 RepID=A0A1V8SSW8_9PEZI|nr:hypothetical protein B0A48_11807 [Cryoendolithus antarcticus]
MQIFRLLLVLHASTTAAFTIPGLYSPTSAPKCFPQGTVDYVKSTSSTFGEIIVGHSHRKSAGTTSELKQLSGEAYQWIRANPRIVIVEFIKGVVVYSGGFYLGPTICFLGLHDGLTAMISAADSQSLFGFPSAGEVFATLQRADMSGYCA